MKYQHIVQAEFIDRPNRFIARVKINGREETVHVKNTGRCKELLIRGAVVYLEKSNNPKRATLYDLVSVEKGKRLINMDSQAPNKVVEEWLWKKELFPDLILVRPETKYGNSRFDFYVETKNEKIFIEVKGVTLEEDGIVRFPDAPSDRAVKHVEELIQARKDGYRVFVLFVIQMSGVRYFTPNRVTHKAFAEALEKASDAGVEILAYDCLVKKDSLEINQSVPVQLTDGENVHIQETLNKIQKDVPCKNLEKLKRTLRFGNLSEIPKPLLKWYDNNRRILPWRENPSPYRVWVSEIMLQQTRVEAVKPYFERFMKSLPDIKSLAQAEEEELLKLWEGLGYYNRVRNLQKAARQIMEEHNGEMPADYETLLKLSGIGSYTAGAISSIAYGKKEPAVDGNVLRVLARIRKDE
ncbi:MAG: DNA/RNA nuclease SfsA, partial [Lachnospiraceae bacterium]|nr:DNA/RNA nuclease SfsA [Lachnospiraceae bacterium]